MHTRAHTRTHARTHTHTHRYGQPLRAHAVGRRFGREGNRVWLFDTTLRDGAQVRLVLTCDAPDAFVMLLILTILALGDGAQTRGVDFSVADKMAIARALDDFGVDYIEVACPPDR